MTIETKNKNYVSIVILHLYSLHHLRHIVAFHSVLPPLEEEQQTDTVAYGQSATQLAFAYIYERGKAFRRDCSFRSFLYPGYNTVASVVAVYLAMVLYFIILAIVTAIQLRKPVVKTTGETENVSRHAHKAKKKKKRK